MKLRYYLAIVIPVLILFMLLTHIVYDLLCDRNISIILLWLLSVVGIFLIFYGLELSVGDDYSPWDIRRLRREMHKMVQDRDSDET